MNMKLGPKKSGEIKMKTEKPKSAARPARMMRFSDAEWAEIKLTAERDERATAEWVRLTALREARRSNNEAREEKKGIEMEKGE